MSSDLITWILSIDLDAIFLKITEILTYFLTQLENYFISFYDFIDYVLSALDSLNSYAVNFRTVVNAVFTVLPAFYLHGVVVVIVITILFVLYKRVV
jgi:hypothetical protein